MKKQSVTHVTPSLSKFVVIYGGLAYWFKTKNQYLYRVSLADTFHAENQAEQRDGHRYSPITGSILTVPHLLAKASVFARHPVTRQGRPRQGIEYLTLPPGRVGEGRAAP